MFRAVGWELPVVVGAVSVTGIGKGQRPSRRRSGKVELAGYAVGPRRSDERIAADRVYLFTDAPTGADAWRQAQEDFGILAAAPPDDIDLVDVPWRPGEKAWLLAWD